MAWAAGQHSEPQRNGSGCESLDISSQGTVSITFTWIPDQGDQPPPTPVYFKVTGSSIFHESYGQYSTATSGVASDGLGDPQVDNNSTGILNGQSSGKHLIQVVPTSGTITLGPYSVDTECYESGPQGYYNYSTGYVLWDIEASLDNRGVTISSSLDPTYKRVVNGSTATQVQNVRESDGTLHGDTVLPNSNEPVNYYANVAGTWGQNSTYNWYEAASGMSTNGVFVPGTIPSLTGVYYGMAPYVAPASTDHIFIDLIDTSDAATAHANYYLNFHEPYENWVTTSNVAHPDAITRSGDSAVYSSDWVSVGVIVNDSAGTPTQSFGTTSSVSETESGTVGVQATVGSPEAAALQTLANITVSTECTSATTVTNTFSGAPWSDTQCFLGKVYNVLGGTCSKWVTYGYDEDVPWTGIQANNPLILSPGQCDVYDYPH